MSRDALGLTEATVSSQSEKASPSDVCRSFERVTFESQTAAGNRLRSTVSFHRFTITFDEGAIDTHAPSSSFPTVASEFSIPAVGAGAV